ncbi:hypothetical protein ACOSQ4_002087 [Xanthoceras sorbifolium]
MVKSGYWTAFEHKLQISRPSCSGVAGANWWKTLWGLKISSKIKIFCWKACNNWLPTSNTLRCCHLQVVDCCKCCGLEAETLLHALWSCTSLKLVHEHCLFLKSQPFFGSPSTSLEFFVFCCSNLQIADLQLLMVVFWRFWFRCNKLVHEQVLLITIDVVSCSSCLLCEFDTANIQLRPSAAPVAAVSWTKPQVGLGAVIHDHHCLFMAGLSRKLIGLVSIKVAETAAILNGFI